MQHYLLDENLSRKLVDLLNATLENVTHVALEGLLNSDDSAIWQYARGRNSVIITKDHDFYDRSHLFGCPPKVIKLNCGNRTTAYIGGLLIASADPIRNFAASENCYMEIL